MAFSYFIIINKFAGSGNAAKIWPHIESTLLEKNVAYKMVTSDYAGHVTEIAKERANQHRNDEIIIVIGGDGTLHEAINGLKQSSFEVPIAYIPAGSGNDFARGLGMSKDPQTALSQILAATKPKIIDVGRYVAQDSPTPHYFVNNVGIGFDAAIVAYTNHSPMKSKLNRLHLGSLSYLTSIFHVMSNQPGFKIDVVNGQQVAHMDNAFLVTLSNHPYFGGGVKILPTAKIDSGELELILIEKMTWLQFIHMYSLMLRGKHYSMPIVQHIVGKNIQLQIHSAEQGQVDGEELGKHAFNFDFDVIKYPFMIKL
ncbi:diacylglycerol kinase family lipid kinase [Periweissella cryptocerci]|uniref:Diacylglycerol kinase family lipid kinase n=1 Tax=Periweissella cryptocerci TaxID=2506420 RepID=A0A4P6YWW1_9LACO|nr:diacylglycerol kinase family protein [Periweissella cryptocerci]QBO37340.1 diacylglycerol kinase family lipid kinase [Periweissella cryptocerci]